VSEHISDEQLDAEPQSATKGSIRLTLWHLVASQQGYLSLLTGMEPHFNWQAPPAFAELQKAASITGDGLLALARDGSSKRLKTQLQTKDGYLVEPWVVMVQAINHVTEHREQISSMLSSLGVTPPDLDDWTHGEVTNALTPVSR
jgi:uncharacterized damage-inducible protein DinB